MILMVKRTSTRKKTARKVKKKARSGSSAQKNTKIKRISRASSARKTKKKVGKKKTAVTKKKAKSVKRAAKPKKKAKAARKTAKPAKKAKVAKTAKVTKKKSRPAKKTKVARKKAPRAKKKTQAEVGAVAAAEEAEPEVPEPQEPGLPLKEVRARLGLIAPQIGELEWLDGLYMYGAELLEVARLEQVDFIVVYKRLRSGSKIKAAEKELKELLGAVLPIDVELKMTGTLEIGRLLAEGNPAAQALLGHAETVYPR